MPEKRIWTVPNVLTMFRLALVPVYWVLMMGYKLNDWALCAVVVMICAAAMAVEINGIEYSLDGSTYTAAVVEGFSHFLSSRKSTMNPKDGTLQKDARYVVS